MAAKRVLVVDDAIFMRNMIKDIFASGGFEVVGEAANGLEAVDKYKELKPDLTIYVEYSNEVWNGIFAQADWTLQQAKAEVAAGNSPLNNDGDTNQYYWMWRRTAKRTQDISRIMSEVFGSQALNRKVGARS